MDLMDVKYRVYYRPAGPQPLGTVAGVYEHGVHVAWDNNHFHTYDPAELVVVGMDGHREPSCLRCGADLTDVTPVMIFVDGVSTDALLCADHGANGANMSAAQFEALTTPDAGEHVVNGLLVRAGLDDADDDPATADNTITAPDGTPLLDRYGFPVRTVKAAERTFIQAATVQQAWTDRHNAGLVDVHGMAKASSPWSSTATRMLEALAHKRGGVTDDNMDAVEADLKPRLDKAIAKWRAEHPNHE